MLLPSVLINLQINKYDESGSKLIGRLAYQECSSPFKICYVFSNPYFTNHKKMAFQWFCVYLFVLKKVWSFKIMWSQALMQVCSNSIVCWINVKCIKLVCMLHPCVSFVIFIHTFLPPMTFAYEKFINHFFHDWHLYPWMRFVHPWRISTDENL